MSTSLGKSGQGLMYGSTTSWRAEKRHSWAASCRQRITTNSLPYHSLGELKAEVIHSWIMLFPDLLYRMLDDAERKGFDSIVSWVGDCHFRVVDRKRFEKVVLPMYFESTKFKSFRRFECVRDSRNGLNGCYTHSHFSRRAFDLDAILLLRYRAKKGKNQITSTTRRWKRHDCEEETLNNDDFVSQARMVSPSRSRGEGLDLDGDVLDLSSSSTMGCRIGDKPADVMEPVVWPIDLSNHDEKNASDISTSTEDTKHLSRQQDQLDYTWWMDQVPLDIQNEIIATFSRPPLGLPLVGTPQRAKGSMGVQ